MVNDEKSQTPSIGVKKTKILRKEDFVMKSTGMVRKVDELGRIVLPAEIRQNMDINVRDALEIFTDEGRIILQKYEPSCIFCGSSCGLVTYHGRNVCMECIENMNNI